MKPATAGNSPGFGTNNRNGVDVIRIFDGVAYEVKRNGGFEIKVHQLGNGHLEATAVRQSTAKELDWSPQVIADHLDMMERYREEHAEEIRLRNLQRAAKRARTTIRRLCKAMGCNTLLTLTYRAKETDLARCKADLKEFNRRVERVMPGFRFVAGFEKQDRGAWHVHMATGNIPRSFLRYGTGGVPTLVKSYDLLRSIWRSVTKDRGGNIDVSRRKAHSRKTPAQVAAYISKYITKAFDEGDKWSNRWTAYGAREWVPVDPAKPLGAGMWKPVVPRASVLGIVDDLTDAVLLVYGLMNDSHEVSNARLDRWGEWFSLAAEGGS